MTLSASLLKLLNSTLAAEQINWIVTSLKVYLGRGNMIGQTIMLALRWWQMIVFKCTSKRDAVQLPRMVNLFLAQILYKSDTLHSF